MRTLRTITGQEPISLATAKSYLKATDYTDDDVLITMLISAVRERVEEATGYSYIASTIVYFDDEIEDSITLPFPNHASIDEVKINGEVTTDYYKTGEFEFIIVPNKTYSTVQNDRGIKVTYKTTGYCPEGLKAAMLKLVDESYRNRGNTFEGSLVHLNENAWAMIAPYCKI